MATCDDSKTHRVQFEKLQQEDNDDAVLETTPRRGGLNMYVMSIAGVLSLSFCNSDTL